MKFGRHKIRKSISAWFDWEIHKVRPLMYCFPIMTYSYTNYVHPNVYLYLVGWRSATQIYLYNYFFTGTCNHEKFNHCMYSQRQELVHSIKVSKWNGFLDLTYIFKYMYYLRILNCSSWKFKEYSKIQKKTS